MIQVIEYKPIKEWEIRCPYCNSLLRYTEDDEKGDKFDELYIHCPVCGFQIFTYYPSFEKDFIRYISRHPEKEGDLDGASICNR